VTVTDYDADLHPEDREALNTYGIGAETFESLRARVADGSLSPESNRVRGTVEPPLPEEITPLPEPRSSKYGEAREAGLALLREGRVASAVLNGGMATRFGGVVKGVVEAVDGRSFLEIKLDQARRIGEELGVDVPVAVMTSYATDTATRSFLGDRGVAEPLYFSQYVSLRLQPDGDLFRTEDGRVSLYSPGHGDFLPAIRRSGTLQTLWDRGVRVLMVSNVDNLPARLDPVVIGMHVLAGRPMTAEVVANEGEVGGAPARVDGRVRLLESMQMPEGFDHSTLPVTNVNTITFDLEALDRDFDLTWLYVLKSVGDRKAVQLERLYHEASAFLPTTYLKVPALGPRGRFLPIKTPQDLVDAQPVLHELLARPVLGD
jgi:UTP--glucose-1-phosphate uridylyltransferase